MGDTVSLQIYKQGCACYRERQYLLTFIYSGGNAILPQENIKSMKTIPGKWKIVYWQSAKSLVF